MNRQHSSEEPVPNGAAPLVSVVIPCYKQAHFLGEAIESVLAQSHRPVEIIVVDDGSPDDTAAVAAGYAARHPEVRCLQQENRGLSGARNAGLRQARGELVVFLDADDRLLPGALAAGVRALGEHPECAFVCGHTAYIGADGAAIDHPRRPCVGVRYESLLAHNMIDCPASVMYRRSVLTSMGGFDTALRSCEDHDVYLRIARQLPVLCHHQFVTEYRRHGAGMSQNYERMLTSMLTVLGAQRPYVRGERVLERACAEGIQFYRRVFGEGVVNQLRAQVKHPGSWWQALRTLAVLLRYYPRGVVENSGRKLRVALSGTRVVPGRSHGR